MLNEKENNQLEKLKTALSLLANFKYYTNSKPTESLYRYGYFKIYGYVYYISGWNFRDNVVTLQCDEINKKIKFNIYTTEMYNGDFPIRPLFSNIVKYIKNVWKALKGK